MLKKSSDRLSVPSPDGSVVTDTDDGAAVPADGGLAYCSRAFGVTQDVEATRIRVRDADVPDISFAHLKAEVN
jgi:hypothetical protein